MVGVDVVDVQMRRRGWLELSQRSTAWKRNPGSAGESGDARLAAIADEMIARRDNSRQGEAYRSAVTVDLNRIASKVACRSGRARQGWECCPDRRARMPLAVPPRFRAFLGRSDQRPLKDSRMKVSSASTIPLKPRGLSLAGARRKPMPPAEGRRPDGRRTAPRSSPGFCPRSSRARAQATIFPSCADAPSASWSAH